MKNILPKTKLNKTYKLVAKSLVLAIFFNLAMYASYVYGEQSSGTPESNSTSYIQSLYTDLQTSNYGSDTTSPDWGTYWNRVKTAAQFTPSGTATASNVNKGKTFYGPDRTLQTGTDAPGYCPTQQYYDSYGAPVTQNTNCTDTLTWTTPTDGIAGTEKKDPRSGLIWSNLLLNSAGTVTFSLITNTTFSWDASAASNIAVGGKTATQLCSERGNGWRLPTQKEIMQAYINGAAFNLSMTWNLYFWSSTESGETTAWYSLLSTGTTYSIVKTTANRQVRCVRG
ncbi:MAG: DUF1566 domain-containing protein [Candidatus Saccharibacteria bacterium]